MLSLADGESHYGQSRVGEAERRKDGSAGEVEIRHGVYTAVGVDPGEVTPLSTMVASDYSFENEALTLNKNSSGWEFKVNVIPVPGVFVEDRAKVGFEPSTSHRDPADTLSVRVKVEPHA